MLALIIISSLRIQAMEEPNIDEKLAEVTELKNILTGAPQPEFLEAYKLARVKYTPSLKALTAQAMDKSEISLPEGKIPQEVSEFVNKVKFMTKQIENVYECKICSKDETDLLLNIINNHSFGDAKLELPLGDEIRFNKLLKKGSFFGDIYLVDVTLSLGANINNRDGEGYTALMYATERGNVEILIKLLNAGADIYVTSLDGYYRTALDIAKKKMYANKNTPAIIKILEEAAAKQA